MKELFTFIERLLSQYSFTSGTSNIEYRINWFICLHYNKIMPRKYVEIIEKDDLTFSFKIDSTFEEELIQHYPEKLI